MNHSIFGDSMLIFRILLLFVLVANSHASLVVHVECDYNFLTLGHLINIKSCSVKNEILIQTENTQLSITNPSNAHEYQNSTFCEAFVAENKSIYYFPEYLGIYPPNLKAIVIRQSKLRKITAPNLAGFYNLEYLDLSFNQLLVLKPNLFASNPYLSKIWLNNNKIYHIDSTIFNGLNKLNGLSLTENVCYTASANNLRDALAISKHSLCSDELPYVCGAFSQTFEGVNLQEMPTKDAIKNLQLNNDKSISNLTNEIQLLRQEMSDKHESKIRFKFMIYALITVTLIMYLSSIIIMCYFYSRNENEIEKGK